MQTFSIRGKTVTVFPAGVPDAPVIFLNTFSGEAPQILQAMPDTVRTAFSLVAVCDLDWNHDMAPWDCPAVFRSAPPCTGGADDYLEMLTREILPAAEQGLPGTPRWRGIAGYSLAGLFAVYALCRTDLFSRAACLSGSLWFPGMKEYLFSHPPLRRPDCLYFSLGDKESRTRNPLLKSNLQNTREIWAFYRDRGIATTLCMNPGNHFAQTARRTADGLLWILER